MIRLVALCILMKINHEFNDFINFKFKKFLKLNQNLYLNILTFHNINLILQFDFQTSLNQSIR